jgi:hypothetical protein
MHLPVIHVKNLRKCHSKRMESGTPFSVPSPVNRLRLGALMFVLWLHDRFTSPCLLTLTFAPQVEQL